MWRAQQASKASVVGMPAMIYINRREFGNTKDKKLFNAQQMGKTMIKYSSVCLSIIAFIWRTYEMPVVSQRGDDWDVWRRRLLYYITGKQDMWLQKVKAIVGQDTHHDEQEDDWFDEADTDDESDEERLDDA
jgi:hypothetical protein